MFLSNLVNCRFLILTFGLSLYLGSYHVAAGGQIKIMALGDSITQGGHSSALAANLSTVGYRYDLYFKLKNAGYDIDFVGTQTTIDSGTPNPAHYPLYNSTFDRHNQGDWGRTAVFLNNNMNGYLSTLGVNRPDVLLIHAGTNDLRESGTTSDKVATALGAIGGIIDKARTANSNVKVFVTSIDNGATHSACLTFNAALPGFVGGKTTVASPVYFVDMVAAGFNYTTGVHTYDGTHMNKAGEDFTSQQWFNAMVNAGVFVPEPTALMILLSGSAILIPFWRIDRVR